MNSWGQKAHDRLTRGWGKGNGDLLPNGYGVSFWGGEVLEIDGGDGCTTLRTQLMSTVHFKVVYMTF